MDSHALHSDAWAKEDHVEYGPAPPSDSPKPMDPNKLSMQEGKAFLRQLGIPQRDVDMMTEKWVVIASVEVLLRFPLRPGEDPSVRCVSREKFQPLQPHVASQRPGDQNRRKPHELLPREKDKPQSTRRQRPGPHAPGQPCRPPTAQSPRRRAAKAGQPAAPRAEESRVSCRNSPAFGRLASSRRCPTKSGNGTLAPQPLSACEQKENVESRTQEKLGCRETPGLRPTGSFRRASGEGDPAQRQEEQQRKAPPQKCPGRPQERKQSAGREPPELEVCLRRPTRPMPVPTTKNRAVLGPLLTAQPPAKTPSKGPCCPSQPLEKVPGLSACGSAVRLDVAESAPRAGKGFSQDPRTRFESTAGRPGLFAQGLPQPARSALAPGRVCRYQTQVKCPEEGSKASQLPAPAKCGQNSLFSIQAGGKRPAPVSIQTVQDPSKKARLSRF